MQVKYKNGFTPTFHEADLVKTFKPGDTVFVSDMGDIAFATRDQIRLILQRIHLSPKTTFLFCSKNPAKYNQWGAAIPPNVILGTTIETNRDISEYSRAPSVLDRVKALSRVEHRRFISIEPIMDFDIGTLAALIQEIVPCAVEVGADNYNHRLPEPPPEKLEELLSWLESRYTVHRKEGLDRLLPIKRKRDTYAKNPNH